MVFAIGRRRVAPGLPRLRCDHRHLVPLGRDATLRARQVLVPAGLAVDEQSVVIATYEHGLSVLQTRWGTFTDPWLTQPYPRCGFTVVGTSGTILSEDYASHVWVQTRNDEAPRAVPVDAIPLGETSATAYLIESLESAHRSSGRVLGSCRGQGRRSSMPLSAASDLTVDRPRDGGEGMTISIDELEYLPRDPRPTGRRSA